MGSMKRDRRDLSEHRDGPTVPDPINGIYSGPSIRVRVSDGTFAPIENMPRDTNRKIVSDTHRPVKDD